MKIFRTFAKEKKTSFLVYCKPARGIAAGVAAISRARCPRAFLRKSFLFGFAGFREAARSGKCVSVAKIKSIKSIFAFLRRSDRIGDMEIENAGFIGTGLVVLTSLLGAYYLVLRIREFHAEKPDPKLTYVTYSHMEKVRAEMMRCVSDAVQDLRSLRAEIREETRSMHKCYSRGLDEARELISRNAQNISSLVAQAQIANQRIAELSVKTDRLFMKSKEAE